MQFGGTCFAGAQVWKAEKFHRSYGFGRQQRSFGAPFRLERPALLDKIKYWWQNYTEEERVLLKLIAANVAIFALWRIPSGGAQRLARRFFLHIPHSGRLLSMVGSSFSHVELWHLGLNMYVLWNFGGHVVHLLGTERFLAFYLTAGMSVILLNATAVHCCISINFVLCYSFLKHHTCSHGLPT